MVLAKTITNIAILSNKRKRRLVQVFPFSWSSWTKGGKAKVERVMYTKDSYVYKNKQEKTTEILVFLYLVRFDFLEGLHFSYIYMNTLLFEVSCLQRFHININE